MSVAADTLFGKDRTEEDPVSTDAFEELELMLRVKSAQLTEPRPDECLACFVARMLRGFGCDNTLRWAMHYRDRRSPRATGLERRLEQMGGYCDCEILLNGYTPVQEQLGHDLPDLPCVGVQRASAKPCERWRRASW